MKRARRVFQGTSRMCKSLSPTHWPVSTHRHRCQTSGSHSLEVGVCASVRRPWLYSFRVGFEPETKTTVRPRLTCSALSIVAYDG